MKAIFQTAEAGIHEVAKNNIDYLVADKLASAEKVFRGPFK